MVRAACPAAQVLLHQANVRPHRYNRAVIDALWDVYAAARGKRLPRLDEQQVQTDIARDSEFFRRHMLDGIIPFWQRHSVDDEFGGFTTHLRRDGEWYAWTKITAMQARMAYAFARAYVLSADPQHLKLARHAAGFMQAYLWDERRGGWLRSVQRDGVTLDSRKLTFHQAYATIGLSEYGRVAGDDAALTAARTSYDLVRRSLYDGERGGYMLACSRDWTVTSTTKTLCSQLDMAFAALSLYQASKEDRYLNDVVDAAGLMLEHMYDRRHHCLLETCTYDWMYEPRATRDTVWIGHNLKGAWLLLQLYEITQHSAFNDAALAILDFCIRFAYDRSSGGFFHYVFRSGPLASPEKLWWTNCEALLALGLAMRLGDSPHYAHYFNQTVEFCMRSFYDERHGEWFRSCASDGAPINSTKGGSDKAAYHTVQACAYAFEYLRELETRAARAATTRANTAVMDGIATSAAWRYQHEDRNHRRGEHRRDANTPPQGGGS